ncbi:phosphohydrolase [Bacteroidia bacterium]|nr:phosphohydrolase [Bacteroidia bacterium]
MINPEDIVKKYYAEGSKAYGILFTHSCSVAEKALQIARMHPEWAIDTDFVYESAMLHDIGIFRTSAPEIYCFGEYPYICHGYLGADLLRAEGLERHALVCERHVGAGLTKEEIVKNGFLIPARNMLPETLEEKMVCFADKFYSKSHLGREKPVEKIRKSMSKHGEDILFRLDEMIKLFLG